MAPNEQQPPKLTLLPYVRWQGNVQKQWQPANWIPICGKFHSDEIEWTFTKTPTTSTKITNQLTKDLVKETIVQAANNLAQYFPGTWDGDVLEIEYYTGWMRWLDMIRIELKEDVEQNASKIVANVQCTSTGFCPLLFPLALLLNLLLFFWCFSDATECYKEHSQLAKETIRLLGSEGYTFDANCIRLSTLTAFDSDKSKMVDYAS